MTDSPSGFKVLRAPKPGDTRQVPEKAVKKLQLDGRYDSYSQIYEFDGARWKVSGQMSQATGETLYTLVCVNE